MKYFMVLMICFSISSADRLIFLGQASLSDYHSSEISSSGCQYDGDKVSSSLVIQYQFSLTDLFDGGVELDARPFYPFRWIKPDSSGSGLSCYTYDYREYSLSLFLAANRDFQHTTVFAKVVPGIYMNTRHALHDYYGHWMSDSSNHFSTLHFGFKLMTGIDVHITEGWGIRLEGGRTFLRREGFPYYFNPLDKLDSWNLRLGITRGTP